MPTRRSLLPLGLSALLVLTGCVTASAPAKAPNLSTHYVDTESFVLARVIAPPPADDSPETRAELDHMMRVQSSRFREASERAVSDAKVTVFQFADAVGSGQFVPSELPQTTELFRKIGDDETWAAGSAKDIFKRPRPHLLEPRLQPLIQKPSSYSYPSGHAAWGFVVGLVLSDMLPEKRPEIMARAREYANNRVVVGVHYPSDVEAGLQSGTALATALFSSVSFRADEAAAKKELRAALGLQPLTK